MTMWLSDQQVGVAMYAFRDLIARRTLGGQPIHREITDLYKRLVVASAYGTGTGGTPEESAPDELIGTRVAAKILGCSTRWVRHIVTDLDGQKCCGRWVFPRQVVVEYAELKGIDVEGN